MNLYLFFLDSMLELINLLQYFAFDRNMWLYLSISVKIKYCALFKRHSCYMELAVKVLASDVLMRISDIAIRYI